MTTNQYERTGKSHTARISDGPGDLSVGMQLDMQGTRRDVAAGPATLEMIVSGTVISMVVAETAGTADTVHLGAATDDTTDAGEDDVPAGTSFARCADGNGTLTHLFFSDDEFDIARAKAICGRCGLAETCLAGALDRVEPYGVWGGKLVIDGVVVEVKRGRGRPPKTPRPPLVVDEVPLPPHLVA